MQVIEIRIEGEVDPDFRFILRTPEESHNASEDWRLELAEWLASQWGGEYPGGELVPPELPPYIYKAFKGKITVAVKRDDGVEVTYP